MKTQPTDSLNTPSRLAVNQSLRFCAVLMLCLAASLCAPQTARALYLTTTNIQGTTPGNWLTANDWQTNTAPVGQGIPGTQTGPKVNLSVVGSAGSAVPCEIIGSGVLINTAVAATTVPPGHMQKL